MLYFLIAFIFMVVFLISLFSAIYLIQKNKRNKFDSWLFSQQFTASQKLGGVLRHYFFKNTYGLLVDIAHKKICKHLEPIIYNFSDIISAEINKNNIMVTNTQSDTSSKIKGGLILPTAKINSSTSGQSITKDESTYEVYIRTNSVLNPLITIPCGKDGNEAYRVYSCIESILNTKNELEK